MSKIRFGDGIPEIKRRKSTDIYPEELLDKNVVVVRCEKREGKDRKGYHCTCQSYKKDISPDDKACVIYWDKKEEKKAQAIHDQDIENRRKYLWNIYAKTEPVKLPIVHDGYGMIPMCPVCGEMPYSTKQCHWCGQRFVQDKDVDEYSKEESYETKCLQCGGKMIVIVSKYNGHKRGCCCKCGAMFME